MRVCKKCKVEKPLSDFYKGGNPRYKDGRKSICKECDKKKVREWQAANSEKVKENRMRWKRQNPAKENDQHLRSLYGISAQQYEELSKSQGHVCAICGEPEKSKTKSGKIRRLAIDHDHVSGKVRGLLCSKCNPGLGNFRDNPDILYNAITYLVKPKCQN